MIVPIISISGSIVHSTNTHSLTDDRATIFWRDDHDQASIPTRIQHAPHSLTHCPSRSPEAHSASEILEQFFSPNALGDLPSIFIHASKFLGVASE